MTEEEIIKALCLRGNVQTRALTFLYQTKGREFGRYFVRNRMNISDAEDAVQDTILKILKYASSFNNEGTAKAWMWQIARNTLIDFKRKEKTTSKYIKNIEEKDWNQAIGADGGSVGIFDDEKIYGAENIIISPNIVTNNNSYKETAEECVSKGLKDFELTDPERAYALGLFIEGVDGKEIAERIGRSYDATRQYLKQCREKISPFISNCLQLLN